MKKILITGANGQLGSELKRLSPSYDAKYAFDYTDKDELDISSLEAIDRYVKDANFDYIINCAAYTAVDAAEDNLDICYMINKEAVANLAKCASKYSIRIINVSTDYVFDGTATKPMLETDAVNPQSAYGKSKLEGELELTKYCPESITIRTAWLYSIYGNNFVKTMLRLGKERDNLNVVADQKGTPTTAADLAQAIMHIVDYSETNTFKTGIYHYTNEGETTWCDFTKEIHRLANITCDVKGITTAEYPTKAKRPAYSVLSKEKIKSTFGLTIPQWEESLKACVKILEA